MKGRQALSDAELIGILIGSGTASMSAIDVAKSILIHNDNNLNSLAKLSVKDLTRFKGIGEAKAINIISALELGRRRASSTPEKKIKITSAKDAYDAMRPELLDLAHEEFWVILLNRGNQIIKKQPISAGGVSGTVADPKIIFKSALDLLSSNIILVHNHPSGNIKPSKADIQLTEKLKSAGDLLDISVLDHIIFTDENYFSFANENLL